MLNICCQSVASFARGQNGGSSEVLPAPHWGPELAGGFRLADFACGFCYGKSHARTPKQHLGGGFKHV